MLRHHTGEGHSLASADKFPDEPGGLWLPAGHTPKGEDGICLRSQREGQKTGKEGVVTLSQGLGRQGG